jgi:TRAP-type C4-dicarboxylate transport system substrate-binding protein
MRLLRNIALVAAAMGPLMLVTVVAEATQFKIATIAPEGSQWMLDLQAGAKEIKEQTEGRATFKFYGGGVMGSDKKVLRKIRIGQLHGGVFTANGVSERYSDIVIYGLPMLFQSQEEVDYVRERMDAQLLQGLDDAGLVSFGFAGGGFAKLMGNEPITRLEDLRGRKVWAPEGDRLSYEAMEAIELAPVILPITDVLTGLQTGLLEYVVTPPVGAIVLQWYTKVKYVTEYPFAYTLGTMAIEKRAFTRLSEADQAVVAEVFSRIYAVFEKQNRIDNRLAEDALKSNGLKFVELDAALIPGWRSTVAAANRKMALAGEFSLDMFDQVLAYLEEFRSTAAGQTSAQATE